MGWIVANSVRSKRHFDEWVYLSRMDYKKEDAERVCFRFLLTCALRKDAMERGKKLIVEIVLSPKWRYFGQSLPFSLLSDAERLKSTFCLRMCVSAISE